MFRISLLATADNTTLAQMPFGKQPGFIPTILERDPAVSPMRDVMCNVAHQGDRQCVKTLPQEL